MKLLLQTVRNKPIDSQQKKFYTPLRYRHARRAFAFFQTAAKPAEKGFDDLTDKERGESLGYRVMILSEAALEAVQLYAPDVWDVLTSIGLGI